MITITLHDDEADAVERILDLIITDEAASKVVFRDGAERRSALRASKKIYWAKNAEGQ